MYLAACSQCVGLLLETTLTGGMAMRLGRGGPGLSSSCSCATGCIRRTRVGATTCGTQGVAGEYNEGIWRGGSSRGGRPTGCLAVRIRAFPSRSDASVELRDSQAVRRAVGKQGCRLYRPGMRLDELKGGHGHNLGHGGREERVNSGDGSCGRIVRRERGTGSSGVRRWGQCFGNVNRG